jgi:hypothetical protein
MKAMRSSLLILSSALALAAAAPAAAQDGPPVSEQVLAEARGGFLTVDGLKFDFGLVTRSYLDGNLALESRLTVTDQGVQLEDGTQPGGGPTAGALASLAAAGINLSNLGDKARIFVSPDGASALIQGAGASQMANLLLNTGDNRDLAQHSELTLTLPGFEGVQQDISAGLATRALMSDVADRTVAGLGR